MVPRAAHISDLIEELAKKLNLSEEIASKVRIYEGHSSKFLKTLSPEFQIMGIGDYLTLYAAIFPEDDSSKKISVFHFDKEPLKAHGVPFQFPLREVCSEQRGLWIQSDMSRVNHSVRPNSAYLISPRSKASNLIRSSSLL